MKAALYPRVSTDGQTVENQRAPLEELASARGWEAVWYEETGSAVKARPVFERMMDDARRGRVRVVAVVALDRLGRSMAGVINTVLELERLGCKVVSLREPWLDTAGPYRSLLLAIFAAFAELERTILVERTTAGLARARERGTRSGKPIGRPRASQLLLGAGARYRAGGLSFREAAKRAGVSEPSLRRYCKALAAPRNDEGPGGGATATPEASERQNPRPGGAIPGDVESTG